MAHCSLLTAHCSPIISSSLLYLRRSPEIYSELDSSGNMQIVSQTLTTTMLLFKILLLIPNSVLSAAFVLKSSAPAVADFAGSDLPSMYNGIISWFKPPYLYIVINCIIATIFACSKLQSRTDEDSSPLTNQPENGVARLQNEVLLAAKSIYMEYPAPAEYSASDVFGVEEQLDKALCVKKDTEPFVVNAAGGGFEFPDDATSNKENEYVISKYSWNAEGSKELTEYSSPNVKPPASTRFGHRRNMNASPEGGRAVLGVSTTKIQDTLETTWKTITEDRVMPLTRHLTKSDTWERNGNHVSADGRRHQLQEKTPQKMMTKAETFTDRTNNRSPSPGGSSGGGSGKLRRDPSLSQDELNRRVEAFIRKFNEEMRLQRQESLNQHLEMVSRHNTGLRS